MKKLKPPKANATAAQMKAYLERATRRAEKEKEKAILLKKVENLKKRGGI